MTHGQGTFLVPYLILMFYSCVVCNKIDNNALGCGGFIKSGVKIDFSRIFVELYTKQGSLKGKTDCAPNNGYFFIPIYENGDYFLQVLPPPGWTMSPSKIQILFDGKTDACSRNEDINFQFIGFGIIGSIISRKNNVDHSGPSGIKVWLSSSKIDANSSNRNTVTDNAGVYNFDAVPIGEYFIRINTADFSRYNFLNQEVFLVLGKDVGSPPPIIIKGYNVTGIITAHDGEPVADVEFRLLSVEKLSSIWVAISNAEGKFTFDTVHVGQYSIHPQNVEHFSLIKKSGDKLVTVRNDHVSVSESNLIFVVNGFKVIGSVKGVEPLRNVLIQAVSEDDSKFEAISNQNGSFILSGLKRGQKYKILAFKEGYQFDENIITLTEPQKELATIKPVKFLVSGYVDMGGSITLKERKVEVRFDLNTVISSNTTLKLIEKVSVAGDGSFSMFFSPGAYFASVEISQNEANNEEEIGFASVQHQFVVTDAPLSGIKFVPVKATIKGAVVSPIKPEIPFTLNLLAINTQTVVKSVESSSIDGSFTFYDILPGSYIIQLTSNVWCWSKESVSVNVVADDVSDLEFVQLGYKATVHSSHSINLMYTFGDESKTFPLISGKNSVCFHTFAESVELSTISSDDCNIFKIEPKKLFFRDIVDDVNVRATEHIISGRVFSKSNISDLVIEMEEANVGPQEINKKILITRSDLNNGENFVYEFRQFVKSYRELIFTPISNEFLFRPTNLHLSVGIDCMLNSIHFHALKGHFVQGNITPNVSGVTIKAFIGQNSVPLITQSDIDGNYMFGPFYEAYMAPSYTVMAEKVGYEFEETPERGFFIARKLASIKVIIVDHLSEAAIPGVVVSLTGGMNYRNNIISDESGQAVFMGLSSNDYFMKTMLKEYEFNPRTKLINLLEGVDAIVYIKGIKVSFSLHGTLTTLNGSPQPGVTLIAIPNQENASCHVIEEATSESNGAFRIRGLLPHCGYYRVELNIEASSSLVERVIPRSSRIVVRNESDILENLHLVAMPVINTMVTTFIVTVHPDERKRGLQLTLQATVSLVNDRNTILFRDTVISGELVYLPALEMGLLYKLYVEGKPLLKGGANHNLSPSSYRQSVTLMFSADEYYKHLNAALEVVETGRNLEKQSNQIWALIAIFCLFLYSLYREHIYLDRLYYLVRKGCGSVWELWSSPKISKQNDDDCAADIITKKRKKGQKIH